MNTNQIGTGSEVASKSILSDGAKLKQRIAELIAANPDMKARWRSMKSVRWCLYSPQLNLWAGMSGLEIAPVTRQDEAQIFDGRDNEDAKLAFYSALTGIAWQIQLVN